MFVLAGLLIVIKGSAWEFHQRLLMAMVTQHYVLGGIQIWTQEFLFEGFFTSELGKNCEWYLHKYISFPLTWNSILVQDFSALAEVCACYCPGGDCTELTVSNTPAGSESLPSNCAKMTRGGKHGKWNYCEHVLGNTHGTHQHPGSLLSQRMRISSRLCRQLNHLGTLVRKTDR